VPDAEIDENMKRLKKQFTEQGSLDQFANIIQQLQNLCATSNQPTNLMGFLSTVLQHMNLLPFDGHDMDSYTRNICDNILSNSPPCFPLETEEDYWKEIQFPPASIQNDDHECPKVPKPSIPTRPLMWSKIPRSPTLDNSNWISYLADLDPPELDYRHIEQTFYQKPPSSFILPPKRANSICMKFNSIIDG
jgi:hypothetical protein